MWLMYHLSLFTNYYCIVSYNDDSHVHVYLTKQYDFQYYLYTELTTVQRNNTRNKSNGTLHVNYINTDCVVCNIRWKMQNSITNGNCSTLSNMYDLLIKIKCVQLFNSEVKQSVLLMKLCILTHKNGTGRSETQVYADNRLPVTLKSIAANSVRITGIITVIETKFQII